jgi:hypothetical protein
MAVINAISSFDEAYQYKGYVLVNELYEDSEGFYKNTWMVGKVNGDNVEDLEFLEGLSSNSYARFAEAHKKFIDMINASLGLTDDMQSFDTAYDFLNSRKKL